ncbi:ethylbenzene dehydrogenase-related protein [Thermopirellula anaerolimosa]
MRTSWIIVIGSACLASMWATGCRKPAGTAPLAEVTAITADTLPEDPDDPAWRAAPEYQAALLLQDLVEPRLMTASTPVLRVRALLAGERLAVRLEWDDATQDDVLGAAAFSDACAVQVPQVVEDVLPAPQMGESGRPVEITLWKAVWQRNLESEDRGIRSVYPNAVVDHYPFEAASLKPGSPPQREMADRYAPAKHVGNDIAQPKSSPVQDLTAEGPGTITVQPQGSIGRGRRTQTGWAVVIVRKLGRGFTPDHLGQIAFAVWDAAHGEVGSRKMRTAWIPLKMGGTP